MDRALDTGAFIKHLTPHRKEYWGNLIEPVTAEAYGARASAFLPKLILYGCASNISKANYLK